MGSTNKIVRGSECTKPSSYCWEIADMLARIGDKRKVVVTRTVALQRNQPPLRALFAWA